MSRFFRGFLVLAVLLAGCQPVPPPPSAPSAEPAEAVADLRKQWLARCRPVYRLDDAVVGAEARRAAEALSRDGYPTTETQVLEALALVPPAPDGAPRFLPQMEALYLIDRRDGMGHTEAVADLVKAWTGRK